MKKAQSYTIPDLKLGENDLPAMGRRYVNSLTASICQESMEIKYSFVETIESFIHMWHKTQLKDASFITNLL